MNRKLHTMKKMMEKADLKAAQFYLEVKFIL